MVGDLREVIENSEAASLDVTWSPTAGMYTARVWFEAQTAVPGNARNVFLHSKREALQAVRRCVWMVWIGVGEDGWEEGTTAPRCALLANRDGAPGPAAGKRHQAHQEAPDHTHPSGSRASVQRERSRRAQQASARTACLFKSSMWVNRRPTAGWCRTSTT